MKIDKPGRDTLKSYFVKNAVPSASNFEDLIGGALNQRDDGIAKLAGEPLSVQADGDDTSQKKLINFYRNFADPQAAWTLSLAPRVNAADPTTARPGLAIGSGAGATSLFIEQTSGRVGIKTLKPMRDLHVEASELHSGGGGGGFSFSNRDSNGGAFVESPGVGERWVLYAQGGSARLWSGGDKLVVNTAGDLALTGALTVQKNLTLTGALNVKGDVAVHAKSILLGIDGNGGGQLLICNNTNDNRIYLEAFNQAGDGNATELLLTGRNGLAMPQLTLSAVNTSNVGSLSVGTISAPPVGARLMVSGGALMPSAGNGRGDTYSGIVFPPDIGGGGGDSAWMRYYSRGGEALTLEIGCSNDADDHIALMPSGNVGIGTLTPQGKLDVAGSICAGNSDIYFTNPNHNHSGFGNNTGYAAIESAVNFNCLMILGRSTNVPLTPISGAVGGRRVEVWDYMRVNGIFVNNSDATQKRDITRLEYGLDAIRRLRPVSFNWKDVAMPHKTIGLIAQEVRPVISEVVYDDAIDDNSRLSIAYTNLIPVLINAIQELADRLDALTPPASAAAAA